MKLVNTHTNGPTPVHFPPSSKSPQPTPPPNSPPGRAGWVGTRNFEVDSGAYFFNTLYNYYHYAPASHSITHSVLKESGVLSAVLAQVGAWLVEQHHGNSSESYRYPELHGVEGLGKPVGYTGMCERGVGCVWWWWWGVV